MVRPDSADIDLYHHSNTALLVQISQQWQIVIEEVTAAHLIQFKSISATYVEYHCYLRTDSANIDLCYHSNTAQLGQIPQQRRIVSDEVTAAHLMQFKSISAIEN